MANETSIWERPVAAFHECGRYQIRDRGTVIAVELDEESDRDALTERLVGKLVDIDGRRYICQAVESFAIQRLRKGSRIGILVGTAQDEGAPR